MAIDEIPTLDLQGQDLEQMEAGLMKLAEEIKAYYQAFRTHDVFKGKKGLVTPHNGVLRLNTDFVLPDIQASDGQAAYAIFPLMDGFRVRYDADPHRCIEVVRFIGNNLYVALSSQMSLSRLMDQMRNNDPHAVKLYHTVFTVFVDLLQQMKLTYDQGIETQNEANEYLRRLRLALSICLNGDLSDEKLIQMEALLQDSADVEE